jgi:DNA-directed RNA polymerase specialized sigma24 family protein
MVDEYTAIENKLNKYYYLTQRLNLLAKEARESGLLGIALKLGPQGVTVSDPTRVMASGSPNNDWLGEFQRMAGNLKTPNVLFDEISEVLEEQEEIRLLVSCAALEEREKLFVELRYFNGLPMKEIDIKGLSGSTLKDIRRSALQKINEVVLSKGRGKKQSGN